jgi:hypothetical protein
MHYALNVILPADQVSMEKIEKLTEPYGPYQHLKKRPALCSLSDIFNMRSHKIFMLKMKIESRDAENSVRELCQRELEVCENMTLEQYGDYYFKGLERDEDGNLLSPYIPQCNFDYWVVGGRFKGHLMNLENASNEIKDNCCSISHAIETKKIPKAIVVPEGKWFDRWTMDKLLPAEEWEKIVIDHYMKYPEHMVVMLDCHQE